MDELIKKIEAFVAERKESGPGGGWAPCEWKEIHALQEIVSDIIALKYEEDADGDFPIDVKFINRCKTHSMYYSPLPYNHNATNPIDYKDSLRIATSNLALATQDVNRITDQMDYMMHQMIERNKQDGGH